MYPNNISQLAVTISECHSETYNNINGVLYHNIAEKNIIFDFLLTVKKWRQSDENRKKSSASQILYRMKSMKNNTKKAMLCIAKGSLFSAYPDRTHINTCHLLKASNYLHLTCYSMIIPCHLWGIDFKML